MLRSQQMNSHGLGQGARRSRSSSSECTTDTALQGTPIKPGYLPSCSGSASRVRRSRRRPPVGRGRHRRHRGMADEVQLERISCSMNARLQPGALCTICGSSACRRNCVSRCQPRSIFITGPLEPFRRDERTRRLCHDLGEFRTSRVSTQRSGCPFVASGRRMRTGQIAAAAKVAGSRGSGYVFKTGRSMLNPWLGPPTAVSTQLLAKRRFPLTAVDAGL